MRLFGNLGNPAFLRDISKVFGYRINKYGGTPAGVLWKNCEGQQLRFEILAGILDNVPPSHAININDYGCGYGALLKFLNGLPSMPAIDYTGYDVSREMINVAREHNKGSQATFRKSSKIGTPADFTFISGTFNLYLDIAEERWNAYVKSTLTQLWSMSNQGLAFNMLDKDHPEKGEGLYYADPIEFLDFCSRFSNNVTLITDYPLHEWTILIRRD
ncbi:MAG: class I SAM-dependent methyltransferase [Planctomycetes bacterium]|nr:class I SAM-dependent methyltransferase [Planctomycetota bacterium]